MSKIKTKTWIRMSAMKKMSIVIAPIAARRGRSCSEKRKYPNRTRTWRMFWKRGIRAMNLGRRLDRFPGK